MSTRNMFLWRIIENYPSVISKYPLYLSTAKSNSFLIIMTINLKWLLQARSHLQQMSHHMTKPTKWHVRPAKTQISLGIRPVWSVFAVHRKKHWALNYLLSAQWRLWSDWVDAQADLSLCDFVDFVGFVMRLLKYFSKKQNLHRQLFKCFCHVMAQLLYLWYIQAYNRNWFKLKYSL